MQYKISCVKWKKQVAKQKKQVADFIIKTKEFVKKEGRLNNLRSLTFSTNNIEKNVERVFFKNYRERFERSLHLWT